MLDEDWLVVVIETVGSEDEICWDWRDGRGSLPESGSLAE